MIKSVQGAEGAARLKKYWAYGEGREKWIHSPTPYTTLVSHLRKYVPAHELHGLAANIFRLATGHFPGQRKHGERL